jgi:hypothetical protein
VKNKSLLIYFVALITPILIWFTLWSLAQNTHHAHDPNPWIQGFVNNPGQRIFSPTETSLTTAAPKPQTQWIHVIADAGELYVTSTPQKTLLKNYVPTSERLILLVEAQGPELAGQLFRFLKEKNLLKNSLVLAVSDGLLKDVRYYDGELALGAGQAYVVRFRALQTFALENFLSVQMSGIWLRPEIFKQSTQKLANTFNAMKVPVFIGPVKESQLSDLPTNANYLITK